MRPRTFYSNGKLLLTGEYLVLDGATALAVPTQFGQLLTVEPIVTNVLKWNSYDHQGNLWFESEWSLNHKLKSTMVANPSINRRLEQILNATKKLNASFLNIGTGINVNTFLDFPRDWGLGTSSTLINNVAQWASIDPYQLLEATFGGSGYDIACARYNKPITYQLKDDHRKIKEQDFNPDFKNHLYFVFLNKKQNSRDGIARYNENKGHLDLVRSEINGITREILTCSSLAAFQSLMTQHENIIGQIIKQKPIKDQWFKDFNGSIKSLGAWGGDFILAASEEYPKEYFKNKGFNTLIPYREMVLNHTRA